MTQAKSVGRFRKMMAVGVGLGFGVPVGIGVYTFHFAKGASYFSSRPEACINCHVMKDQFFSWQNSSHHGVATCNTCHSPGNWFEKYQSKALNGFEHSLAFTTGKFHEPIQIKPRNHRAVLRACVECHRPLLETSHLSRMSQNGFNCLQCHREVGHRK